MQPRRSRGALRDLVKVGDAYRWASPPGFGAHVRLNSGGPAMLIVDVVGELRTCAWAGSGGEATFDYRMLRPAD